MTDFIEIIQKDTKNKTIYQILLINITINHLQQNQYSVKML